MTPKRRDQPRPDDLAVCAGCLRVAPLTQLYGHKCPGTVRRRPAELGDWDRNGVRVVRGPVRVPRGTKGVTI